MVLLDAHLGQISLCAQTIADLPFPPSSIFTNTLIQSHDITILIRDTDRQERSLFSVADPVLRDAKSSKSDVLQRHATFNMHGGLENAALGRPTRTRDIRRNTGFAMEPSSNVDQQLMEDWESIRASGRGNPASLGSQKDLDIELLLKGAQKLGEAYPIPGAGERIASLREKYRQLKASIEQLDVMVGQQAIQLHRMNRSTGIDTNVEEDDEGPSEARSVSFDEHVMTKENLEKEEDNIRALELKKRALESRVNRMEKDLDELLR